ncbi:sensor histidine kinase [Salinarimonas sp. NSM]|uniref:sensor histidine kinase n=1 Tax=Salinarimonas sp. NSM TaxID=3458003 RepID=UPI0040373005
MRITSKIALVGGIPIAIAAAIAVAAWLLLGEAERARSGAALAGAAYRELGDLTRASDDYVRALPARRVEHAVRFSILADGARATLRALAASESDPSRRAAAERLIESLAQYRGQMDELVAVTTGTDERIAEMGLRAAQLIALAEAARLRQRESNADIAETLTRNDRRMRLARDVVDLAQEARAAVLSLEAMRLAKETVPSAFLDPARARRVRFGLARLRAAALDLAAALRAASHAEEADRAQAALAAYVDAVEANGAERVLRRADRTSAEVTAYVDDLIKIHATEQRALLDGTGQLLAYSVEAGETEQATQNVAVETLKLGRRTADALAARDVEAVAGILAASRALLDEMSALPISPLIQTEMIDAFEGWSARLSTTAEGIAAQNALLRDMSRTERSMQLGAQDLNDVLGRRAERIGETVRRILVLGAAVGLLLGALAAFLVARSITTPLKRLRQDMLVLARNPAAGAIAPPRSGWGFGHDGRIRDELASMAHAVNVFVTEIGRRESDLRRAKDEVDATLDALRRTQADLIQAEKLASLGQLVAGVAHEINTPLGVALTTATALEGEVERLKARIDGGKVLRSDLDRGLARLGEGAGLVHVNLARAADMVQSFKRVAADQTSEDRRRFEMAQWLRELLTSLGPALRKRGHEVATECPPDLVLDTYPGALAQVFTNLIMNAVDHAFAEGASGRMRIVVSSLRGRGVRIVFSDDGRGIPPEAAAKVFEPFYTTARERGNTGLGLHIVYNLVTATLMGRIELDARAGQGARFVIDLPASPERAELPALAAQ